MLSEVAARLYQAERRTFDLEDRAQELAWRTRYLIQRIRQRPLQDVTLAIFGEGDEDPPPEPGPLFRVRFLGCGDLPVPNWTMVVRSYEGSSITGTITPTFLATDADGWVEFGPIEGWLPDDTDFYHVQPVIGEVTTSPSVYSGLAGLQAGFANMEDTDSSLTLDPGTNRFCYPGCLVSFSSLKVAHSKGSFTVSIPSINLPPWSQTVAADSRTCSGGFLFAGTVAECRWQLNWATGELRLSCYTFTVGGTVHASQGYFAATCSGQTSTLAQVDRSPTSYTCEPFEATYDFTGTVPGTALGIGTVTLTRV